MKGNQNKNCFTLRCAQTSEIPFQGNSRYTCASWHLSDIRYEIRDGMLNISFSYPGKNKWISIHRDLLRDFVLDNENKSHGT